MRFVSHVVAGANETRLYSQFIVVVKIVLSRWPYILTITPIVLFNSIFAFSFSLFVRFLEPSLRPMSCDVVVVGGGISGMYMAETLMRMKKEDKVIPDLEDETMTTGLAKPQTSA